jgi:hypothetical protein
MGARMSKSNSRNAHDVVNDHPPGVGILTPRRLWRGWAATMHRMIKVMGAMLRSGEAYDAR